MAQNEKKNTMPQYCQHTFMRKKHAPGLQNINQWYICANKMLVYDIWHVTV